MDWEQLCAAPAQLKLVSLNEGAASGSYCSGWHSHPFVEWGMVLEGRCEWRVAKTRYLLGENELFLLAPGAVHREFVPKGGRVRLAWVGFVSAALMPHGAAGAAGAPADARLRIEAGEPPYAGGGLCPPVPLRLLPGVWAAEIRRLFLTLYDEQSESAYGSETRIGLCLAELLLLVTRALHAMRKPDGGASAELPAAVRMLPRRQVQLASAASRFFDNNTAQGVTVESVARYFRLTPQYFSTLFRAVHGVGPAQYQQRARVRQARGLLAGSRDSVKEIAARCGYADSAHFCRQFKQREGCSPMQYRLRAEAERAGAVTGSVGAAGSWE